MNFRPIHNLSIWITAIFVLFVFISIVCLFSNLAQIRLLDRIRINHDFSMEELAANDSRQQTLGWILLGILSLVSILFLIWKNRCYKNLVILGNYPLRFSTHWSVTSYFIPILCYFRPCQIMCDIWDGSNPLVLADNYRQEDLKGNKNKWLIGIWWAFFIIAQVLYTANGGGDNSAATFEDVHRSSVMAAVINLWLILGAIITAYLVSQVTKRQEQRLFHLMELYEQESQRMAFDSTQETKDYEELSNVGLSENEKSNYYGSVLGLQGKVTKNDISRIYKQLIAKYHPDKVAHLGPELQQLAEKKTKEINKAYDYFKAKYGL